MCQFCVQHGDGKRWYLQAANYAAELENDLERRGYMVSFIRDFESNRRRVRAGLAAIRALPEPAAQKLRDRASREAQLKHFGQPVPIEECAMILKMATSVVRLPCLCRGQRRGDEGVCLVVTVRPIDDVLAEGWAGYDDGPDVASLQRLDYDTALDLLRECEQRGLCHTVWTFHSPFIAAICNCDVQSGCMAMNMQLLHGVKVMWKGEWVARLAEERCTSCEECVPACPFGALAPAADGGPIAFDEMACWGCGTCRAACGPGALTLADRRSVPSVALSW